jgi:hypothetical protein
VYSELTHKVKKKIPHAQHAGHIAGQYNSTQRTVFQPIVFSILKTDQREPRRFFIARERPRGKL